jgi:uncharacterized protein (TIGR03382 family)
LTPDSPPAIVETVRTLLVILSALALAACSKPAERTRTIDRPLAVLEGSGNFGSVAVTTTSPPRTFVVAPAPPKDSLQFDIIESIESTCPEFKLEAPGAAGAVVRRSCTAFSGGQYGLGELVCVSFEEVTYSFQVRFAPILELPTSDQCRIIVRFDGGLARSIPVSGIGLAPPLRARFSTTAPIDFFTVNQGVTSGTSSVVITNTGSQELTVSATSTLAGGAFAITGQQAAHKILPGATTTYDVTCTPINGDPENQVYNGSLAVTTDAPNALLVNFPLKCVGVDHPLSPQPDRDIATLVGKAIPVSVDLQNLTGALVTITSIALKQPAVDGLQLTGAIPTTIGPNATVSVALTWTPTASFASGLGALVVEVPGEEPRDVSIVDGTATALLADVKTDVADGDRLDFGKLCIGESSTKPLRMQPGDDPMTMAGYGVVAATSATPFSAVVTSPSAVTIAPATEVIVDVTANPMITDGIIEGTLQVTTDSPTEPMTSVPLYVEVLPAGASVSPPLLNFREVVVTGFSETKTATFSNCTAETIEITGVTLDGDSATDFDIIQIMPNGVEQLPPFSLPRNGEIIIAVQMLPQSNGSKEASVSIDFQETGKPETSNETIALIGEGFFPSPDRDSYYRCSAGSPAHALPLLVIGLFLVLRRRRR